MAETLAGPGWRAAMLGRRPVPTQVFASALMTGGFAGLLVRRFAKGATETSLVMVMWRWAGTGCNLDVIDDEDRLDRI